MAHLEFKFEGEGAAIEKRMAPDDVHGHFQRRRCF